MNTTTNISIDLATYINIDRSRINKSTAAMFPNT